MKEKDDYSITVGRNIVESRLKKKISQKELAEKLQISPTRLNYWEKGKAKPDITMIRQIAVILDVSPSFLLGWDEFDKKYPNMGKEVKHLESFINYLKSIGYAYCSDIDKVVDSHIEDVIDDNGIVIGQTQVIDDAEYSIILSKDGITSVFTQEEFKALQQQSRANIEGAILLQSQKNKKEPSSAATDNGSSNENTVK